MTGGPPHLPLVGVLACQKERANGTTYSRVNDHLTEPLLDHAGVAAVLIHTVRPEHARSVLARLDGLVLPGSGSFVHPARYGGREADAVSGREYDPARDETAAALLRAADEMPGLPVLASCRGMQELAVHHGGTLAQVPPSEVKHRLRAGVDGPDRWAPAHTVAVRPGGLLAELAGPAPDPAAVPVNSQHSDRLDKIPGEVFVEAVAPDGTVEAISVGAPDRFVLGVQWHFEHHTDRSVLDRAVLAAFGSRCRSRMTSRKPQ
ncbi:MULTISPECIES: gamma-glutamyl-gamma-aminobutyrate hydrolase family protein [Streptomyces]|uniref:Gamma-glutamyl-gamma-aminobutyrate hydrolase family protein n=1 Tax=Streptomyces koelreuteriae TaxID=2838015 RepID=A0ABX8FPA7_9ACTN|nr:MULTISPECIES: gamma-glutamyl-gamma-aminobutyrate hydrolase family protein [Streptomyces]QWB22961.1 gamma-glutamyl-gamma-aminobutyrate hydrolase family protein [Streptomyces koelreuteriae]UUA05909.1 gamma-glutamyl-gamma-aminobutyrate hydrolase family protein [Streptomyces koelreuteriae]UUA13537.1 gamma-glutamyl-gamma-aminobutyrate hydrolase family protein [Streptomyces sp. CRCS-T-1]